MNLEKDASLNIADPPPPGAAPGATATLMVEVAGRVDRREVADGNTIGRDSRSDVPIDHPTVSRIHAGLARREDGWHLIDLGSQNGATLDGHPITGEALLRDGAALRIGRVRAWFFADAPPADWRPRDEAEPTGKLMRCRCGHIGWAPGYAAGMTLTCGTCGRDVVVNDVAAPPTESEPAIGTCAGCHTDIGSNEAMHACPACGATMHADCWRENRGCAVYGCEQAGALDGAGADHSSELTRPDVDRREEESADDAARPSPLQDGLRVAVLTLVGLPMFGLPAIAFATFRMTRGNYAFAAAAFVGGCAGLVASAWWWLNVWDQ